MACQWLTFNRVWWLFDAKWQDPFKFSPVIARYLIGSHKPIVGGVADCGDHVVVINSSEIALKADEWYYRVYFHHSGYPGSATWTKAYEVHQRDPTKIVEKAVAKALGTNLGKRPRLARLFIYQDDKIPEKIAQNITDQIRPLRRIPKRLDHYTKDEVDSFPKLFDYPKDYVYPDTSKGRKPLHR